jgi:hypothetical protein
VTLRGSDIEGVLATTSDAEGRYLFEGLAAGSYRVSADLDGYAPDQFRVFGTREWPDPDRVCHASDLSPSCAVAPRELRER